MNTNRLKIIPTPLTGWRVELAATVKPVHFPDKAQAIWFSIAWATQHEPCAIEIYGESSRVERTMTFPDGAGMRREQPDRRRRQVEIAFSDRRHRERRMHA